MAGELTGGAAALGEEAQQAPPHGRDAREEGDAVAQQQVERLGGVEAGQEHEGREPNRRWQVRAFMSWLEWLSSAPLGRPVVPEV